MVSENKPLFDKVLVANRGEIALRIMKTLRKMGIKSVAVYSEADTNSLHVQYADEAYYIGNSPATESYLSIKNVIAAVTKSGASAVHPGYGFLSENPNFAGALRREGVTLIGPSAQAIKKMGDKVEAKKIAIEAGTTTVPGYVGTISGPERAIEIAKEIGFPVIVKAAAGGGGRGMRVVRNEAETGKAFESATLEAASSFSDPRVFIEKLIISPRHIEIQVLADQYGNVVCLGERECSIQRYHQKVIEESPSPVVDDKIRKKMYEESAMLCRKVGYYSAGTVEFIMDEDKNFYFLEMNTRLQVEHPITEMVTGIDIVEQMVRIAAGEKLSFSQEDITLKGWAMEARICSEDPTRGFLPSSGRISEYNEPPKNPNLRIDTGIYSGAEVSMFYDPMVAKLCAYGSDRKEAIENMKMGLGAYLIKGVSHNISFLEAIMRNPSFESGDINTDFISREYPSGFSGAELTSETTEVFLATAIFVHIAELKRQYFGSDANIGTRWIVSVDEGLFPLVIKPVENGYNIRTGQSKIYIRSDWNLGNKLFAGSVNGTKVHVKIDHIPTGYIFTHSGTSAKIFVRSPRLSELEALMPKKGEYFDYSELAAPIGGQILSVRVKEGDQVKEGDDLVILTAMKMENTVTAQRDAKIKKILISEGDKVSVGQILIEFS